jgi:hypothetical protein
LRDFEERLSDGEYVPWTLVPVPPQVHCPAGSAREVIVDTRRLQADVRPCTDVAGGREDAAYRDSDSALSDGEDAPRPKRARRPPSPTNTSESDPSQSAPCMRCGVSEHGATECSAFSRERGAAGATGSSTADLGHDPHPIGKRAAGVEVHRIAAGPDALYTALSDALRSLGGGFANAALATRETLCAWVQQHRRTQFGARTLEGWIAADSEKQWRVKDYVRWISGPVWAGPIECAAFAASRGVNVHVWRRAPTGDAFVRHALFEPPGGTAASTVDLLHTHGRHFDVLKATGRRSRNSS